MEWLPRLDANGWNAAASWLLVVGAGLAAWQIGRQLRQADKQHRTEMELARQQHEAQLRSAQENNREQLQALLRPVMVIPECQLRQVGPATVEVTAWIQNVGPGPAIEARVGLWLRWPNEDLDGDAARAWIDAKRVELVATTPDLKARVGSLVGASNPIPIVLYRGPLRDGWFGPERLGVAIYGVEYLDVFENVFPREGKGDKLGSILLSIGS